MAGESSLWRTSRCSSQQRVDCRLIRPAHKSWLITCWLFLLRVGVSDQFFRGYPAAHDNAALPSRLVGDCTLRTNLVKSRRDGADPISSRDTDLGHNGRCPGMIVIIPVGVQSA